MTNVKALKGLTIFKSKLTLITPSHGTARTEQERKGDGGLATHQCINDSTIHRFIIMIIIQIVQ